MLKRRASEMEADDTLDVSPRNVKPKLHINKDKVEEEEEKDWIKNDAVKLNKPKRSSRGLDNVRRGTMQYTREIFLEVMEIILPRDKDNFYEKMKAAQEITASMLDQ